MIKKNVENNKIHKQHKILKSLKLKSNTNEIVFTRADKGNSVIAIPKPDYIEKTESFLTKDKYKIILKDPTENFQKRTKHIINQSVSLFQNIPKFKLILMNPQISKLYSLIKIHKENNPIRPVVSFTTAPCTKLSKELIGIIQIETNFHAKYAIKNSIDLIDKIKNIQLTRNCKLISFDVQNLFPSIPLDETIQIIDFLLTKNHSNPIKKYDILDCLENCLEQNYFKFNGSIYTALDGLIMGNPLSPLLAEIFMDNFEAKIHSHQCSKNFLYWYRYVDDIICCFKGTDRQLQCFFDYINTIHPKIKFTIEREIDQSINFLDLTITRVNNVHEFSIYRKPTFTDITIHQSSKHPYNQKMAAYNSMLHRLMNVPMNMINFSKELNVIKQIASNNGYNPLLIDNLLYNKQRKTAMNLVFPTVNNHKKFISLTYANSLSQNIAEYFKKTYDCFVSFRSINSLGNIIKNHKDPENKDNKSGVYKLTCGDCPMVYIGQTGRSFKKRMREHQRSYTNEVGNSTYADHLKEFGHSFNHNFEILHNDRKSTRLNLLESLEINRYNSRKVLLNDQTDVDRSPLLNIFK